MVRPKWRIPPDDVLIEELTEWDRSTLRDRLRRWRFVRHETEGPEDGFGIPSTLTGGLLYWEAGRSFIAGNFIAAVVLTHAFVESCLVTLMRDQVQALDTPLGFGALIDLAFREEVIDLRVRRILSGLRKMRNPYVHERWKDVEPRILKRALMETGGDPYALTEQDARAAIQAMTDFLRHVMPAWSPQIAEKR